MNTQTITLATTSTKSALAKGQLPRCSLGSVVRRGDTTPPPSPRSRLGSDPFQARSLLIIMMLSFAWSFSAHADWSVDFSRRQDQMAKPKNLDTVENQGLLNKAEEKGILDRVFDNVVPAQDIVIINTEQGFMPSTIRVKEGAQYRLVVVNVNEKSRNVSFVLDAFSEHHATFYGKIKSFYINPKKEGVYTFISPETSAQGRLVVYPAAHTNMNSGLDVRSPASE